MMLTRNLWVMIFVCYFKHQIQAWAEQVVAATQRAKCSSLGRLRPGAAEGGPMGQSDRRRKHVITTGICAVLPTTCQSHWAGQHNCCGELWRLNGGVDHEGTSRQHSQDGSCPGPSRCRRVEMCMAEKPCHANKEVCMLCGKSVRINPGFSQLL